MRSLSVWIHDTHVATLTERRSAVELAYTQAALDRWAGRPLLSVSMPVRRRAYQGAVPHAFFNGLLPEGEARRMIAYDFGVESGDVISLLEALGRDCAGALLVLPPDSLPAPTGAPEVIDEAAVAQRLGNLRTHPLGVDGPVRASLAGMQEKLLLARSGNDWALPVDGAPSTHILKPPVPLLADSITNEGFCMRIGHHLGIPVAPIGLGTFEDRRVLVVERYDRTVTKTGVTRLHQEDFCQAGGLEPEAKYQVGESPSLRQCAEVLASWAPGAADRYRLLEMTVLNVAIGNADAHAKNASLLHDGNGRISLAPAYDLMSTTYYATLDRTPGLLINGGRDIGAATRADLIAEATSWGLPAGEVRDRIADLLDRLPGAVEAAASDVRPPAELVGLVAATIERLCN